jgi:TonB family protein
VERARRGCRADGWEPSRERRTRGVRRRRVVAAVVTGDVEKPVKISGEGAQYSERARRLRIEGTVVLQTVIDVTGEITQIEVLQNVTGLTLQAIRAVRTWRFQPATLDADPVPVYFVLTVNFELR